MKYLLTLLLLPIQLLATNYYVSNLGSDSNPGTLAQPWATTTKVNSSMGILVSGDSILFARGSEFFGTLNITKDGIKIGAYGNGNLPIITGFTTLSGWVNVGTNLWRANVPTNKTRLNVLTINGVMTRMGRYPNYSNSSSAWLSYINKIATSSPDTVTSINTLPTTYLNPNGELVLRKNSFNLDVMPITAQFGNNFICTNPSGLYGIADGAGGGFGYFIQNHPSTLDVNTEWYFNSTAKTITIFSNTGAPTGTIKVAVFDTLINTNSQSNISIENIDIQGSNYVGVLSFGAGINFTPPANQNFPVGANPGGAYNGAAQPTSGSNLIIKNCSVRYISYWGIVARASNSQVLNNTISDIGSNGIWCNNSATVSGNTIKRINAIEGMGGNQNDQGLGIALQSSSGILCKNNVLDSIGFNGIKFAGSNINIRENVVSNICIIKNDGGGIYTWDDNGTLNFSNRKVTRNIIVNNGKILYGMPGEYATGYFPLYMDGGTGYVAIDSNVIAYSNVSQNSTNAGDPLGIFNDPAILFNNPRYINLTNTITFGFPMAFQMIDWKAFIPVTPKPVGNVITNNCFYVNNMSNVANNWKETNRSFYYYAQGGVSSGQLQTDIQGIGTMNNNFYPDFIQSPFHWGSEIYDGPMNVKLQGWRTFSGKDLNSASVPSNTPEFQYNATSSPTIYNFSGRQKKDFKGNIYNNSATIPPYYANIFFDNGPATGGGLQAFSTATTINCFGGNSTVTVSATGGTAPYTGTGTFTRAAGTWTFTVTDAATPTPNTITTTITITQPLALSATSSKTDVLCNGGSTGTINVFPIGGTPPYSYNWGGGITTQNRTGLAIGTYNCTITDSRNCLTTTSQTIAQPTVLTAGNPTAPAILVNGGTTTITQPAATGGTSPYQYQLNTGAYQTSNIFTNVPAGTYIISIRDANNCIISKLLNITQPTVFTASASSGNISCNGGNTIVVISASGGAAPYTGTGTFVVTAGSYNYIVTDANGATASASITVGQPSPLTISASQVNVLCNGASTGSINITPGGGTLPYTYLWNTGQTTQNRTGLSANTYTVTLTDGNTCSTSQSITITQPTALSMTATPNPVNILCFGGTSAVTVTASGGRSPYSGIGIFNQSVGTTVYNLTDANSCPVSKSVTLTQPTQLTALSPTAPQITVNGGTTTITQPIPTGGVSPYTYALNNGAFQVSNAFQNISAGTYSITIRDANACTIVKTITITQPAVFTATATQTVPINCNGQQATIVVSATGGTSPYTGTGTFQVGSGQFVLTVTDALGNTAPASITITQPSQLIATSVAGAITSVGGTTNIVVSALGGIQPYTGTGSFPKQAGTYSFTVTDANGCTSVTNISVNELTPIPNQSFNSPLPIRNGN